MWTKDLFGTDKPIIALLHLDALPGEPAFCGSLDTIMEHAAADLKALQDGGVDGVLIANEYCFPITPHTSTVTLMAMAAVIGSLKKDIRVPFGVNVVYNPEETIKMAAALGASFGRSAFGGAYTGAYGLHSVNYGDIPIAKGNTELKDKINAVIATLDHDTQMEMMTTALNAQPLSDGSGEALQAEETKDM